jgi:hypothetical protein
MAAGDTQITFGPEWMWGCEKYWECDTRGGEGHDPNKPHQKCSTHGLLIQTLIPEGES